MRQYTAFAFGVPHDINGFHPSTMSSVYLSHSLVVPFRSRAARSARGFYERLTRPPAHPLRPVIPGNAWGLCITAPAGTELGAPYSPGTVNNFVPDKRCLRTEALHPSRGVAPSGFRPLRNILVCSLP